MNNPFDTIDARLSNIENLLLDLRTNQTEPQATKKTDSDLFTIEEAAGFLKLAKPTIYGLVCHSKIPCMKKGKKLYFSKAELIAWLQQGKRKTITELQEEAKNHLINKRKRG